MERESTRESKREREAKTRGQDDEETIARRPRSEARRGERERGEGMDAGEEGEINPQRARKRARKRERERDTQKKRKSTRRLSPLLFGPFPSRSFSWPSLSPLPPSSCSVVPEPSAANQQAPAAQRKKPPQIQSSKPSARAKKKTLRDRAHTACVTGGRTHDAT